MVPRRLPWAIGHDSVMGPATCPPEILVICTTSGSVGPDAALVIAVHVAAGKASRMGPVAGAKYPL
jgi:hypothetical protein